MTIINYLTKLFFILFLLFCSFGYVAIAGTWEPLSSAESVMMDFRDMTPTPGDILPLEENGVTYYKIYGNQAIRDGESRFNSNWYIDVQNIRGGSHAASKAWSYLDFTDQGCFHSGSCLRQVITGGTFLWNSSTPKLSRLFGAFADYVFAIE